MQPERRPGVVDLALREESAPTMAQLATNTILRRRGGRASPTIHAHTTSAGKVAAFSLHARPRAHAAADQPTLSRTSAAYTASTTNSPAMSSARPTWPYFAIR